MLDEIRSDLATMSRAVATARDGLSRNEFVDIGDIGQQVQDIATKINELGPEDVMEIKPQLTALLADFKDFAEEVREKLSALADAGGNSRDAGNNDTGDDD